MSIALESPQEIFAVALQRHRAGRLAEAADIYRRILSADPAHHGALFNMAALAAQSGQVEQAVTLYHQVLVRAPEDPDTLSNLGNLEADRGNTAAAEEYYRRAIARRPAFPAALANLGSILVRIGQHDEAAAYLKQALTLQPNLAAARIGLGTAYWNLGNPAAAKECFAAVLAAEPENAEAHANYGNALAASGDNAEAARHLGIALKLKPDRPQGHFNLALLLDKIGRPGSAMRHLRRAIALKPNYVEALRTLAQILGTRQQWRLALPLLERARAADPNDTVTLFHLGNLYQSCRDFRPAVEHYRSAVRLNPSVPEFYTNLGSVLLALGDVEESIAVLRKAIELRPDFVFAHNNLGNALITVDRHAEAAEAYAAAVRYDPDFAVGHINLGNVLRGLGRFDEAVAAINRGIELNPTAADAHNNLGLLLQAQNRHDEAIEAFRAGLAVQPGHLETTNNLAISYQAKGAFGDAIKLYRDILGRDPQRSPAYFNLGGALQLIGRYDESVTVFKQALQIRPDYNAVYPYLAHGLMIQCNWSNLDATIAKMLANTEMELAEGKPLTVSGFGLMGTSASMDLRYRVARYMAGRAANAVSEITRDLAFEYPRMPVRKIRVGYVSPDFRYHSVAMAFRGLLEAHDRENFEIYGYSLAPVQADAVTAELCRHFHMFHDISNFSFRQAAEKIHADGINILIDLAGHTRFSRPEIFALKPAPVQAHYLGYSSTIGGDFLQYLITDHWQIAPGMDRYFAEKLVYLPETFMATTRAVVSTEPVSRADYGLPEQGFVFGNFNAHYKFEPRLFGIWMRLLKRVPNSVIWFIAGSPTSQRNLRREAEARGVDPSRIIFSAKLPHSIHLARQRLADLALDTLHHGGGVTTVDALWGNVPVVTIAGESPPSRNGATLLAAIGLQDLIADSIDAYEDIAFRLATEPERLAAVKQRLANNRDIYPLFDTERLTRHLESAYRLMWQRWLDGLPPDAIDVPALPPRHPTQQSIMPALAAAG
jgi:predicted O-linked N-acetylglucosamine transferase (SPINDLY family)